MGQHRANLGGAGQHELLSIQAMWSGMELIGIVQGSSEQHKADQGSVKLIRVLWGSVELMWVVTSQLGGWEVAWG